MFKHQEIWLPDGETHFPDWMTRNGEIVDGKGTYQIKKIRAALESVKKFRVAIDVGAHVGLWSMHLAKRFGIVHAFEPVEAFRQCFARNLVGNGSTGTPILYSYALGAERDFVSLTTPKLNGGIDTGGTHVSGDGQIEMRTLDEFDFSDVDFIKIDCEGYEHHVIKGAKETIVRCRPTVIVEQKPKKLAQNYGAVGTPAVDLLKAWGGKLVREIGGDFIVAFP